MAQTDRQTDGRTDRRTRKHVRTRMFMCYIGIVIVVVRSRRRAVCEHVCCRSPNLANTPVTSRPLWVCGQHALYSSVFSLPPRKPHGVASLTHGLPGTWRDLRPEDRATASHGLLCDSEHLAFAEDLRSPLLELGASRILRASRT